MSSALFLPPPPFPSMPTRPPLGFRVLGLLWVGYRLCDECCKHEPLAPSVVAFCSFGRRLMEVNPAARAARQV